VSKKSRRLTEEPIGDAILHVVGTQETDRGCVLVATGFLEERLEEILRKKLQVDDGSTNELIDRLFDERTQGPFCSFVQRAKLARILLLIDEHTLNTLKALAELRNHFAHHPGPVTLTNERVGKIYDALNPNCKRHSESRVTKRTMSGVCRRSASPARKRFAAILNELTMVLVLAESYITILDARMKAAGIAAGRILGDSTPADKSAENRRRARK
jgi:DNA-binding MltR family transcriptional regulator